MSLFSPKVEPEPAGGGLAVLRKMVFARSHKPGSLAQIAGNVDGVGIVALDDFGNGRGTFPVEVLTALATELYGFATIYDAETDLLKKANRPASVMMGVHPPTFAEMKIDQSHLAPRPVPKPTTPPQPAQPKRAD